MNSIERVVKCLNHEEADRVPVYPLINSMSRKYLGINYREWTQDWKKCADSIIAATDDIDVDVICSLVDLSVEGEGWGMPINYPEELAAGPVKDSELIQEIDDYYKVEEIDPMQAKRMSDHVKMVQYLVEQRGQEKPIVAFTMGPLGILSMLRGLAQMAMDCIRAKDAMHYALEKITATQMKYVDALIDTGCHAIMFDTLYASKTILSPKMWNEFEAPYMKRLADHVHERGCMVMLHNCGEGIYFKQQIEAIHPEAISCLYPAADCKDFAETMEKYGDQTTIIGCIEPGDLMAWTPDELRAACEKQIDDMAAGGSFVLATGCEYPAPMDAEYAKIMVDVAKTYGAYNK